VRVNVFYCHIFAAPNRPEKLPYFLVFNCKACYPQSLIIKQNWGKKMDVVGFLEGKTPDHRGRMLSMLWKQTDDDAENNHDYIQWMFLLDEPSQAVYGAPVLNDFDLDEIRENQLVTEN
tara:strand:+ start:80 stop:436 length:357 start_codon:yes stop_codon:yes gene_type:complete